MLGQLKDHASISVTEAAGLLGVNKSNASRLLASLAESGLLTQDPRDRRYQVGPALLEVTLCHLHRIDIRGAARRHIEDLQRKTGESVALGLWTGDRAVCIDRIDSGHALAIVARIGKAYPLHAGATSKAILAFLPAAERDRVLAKANFTRFTSRTITDPAELLRRLEEVRRQGFSISEDELDPGVIGMAAPVFDHQGAVLGAVAVVGPRERIGPERVPEFIAATKAAAAAVSTALGAPAHVLSAIRFVSPPDPTLATVTQGLSTSPGGALRN